MYKALVPLGIKKLPFTISLPITFIIVYLPLVFLGLLIGKIFRPFVTLSKERAYELNLEKLKNLTKSTDDLYSYLQSFQKELNSVNETYIRLSDEVKVLEALKTEGIKELDKTKFVIFREKNIYEKMLSIILAFIAGIMTSVIGSYVYEAL